MAEPVRHRQTKGADTDMFDLQPTRHISTLRVSLIPERPGEGRLNVPTPAVRSLPWEHVLVPHCGHPPLPGRL